MGDIPMDTNLKTSIWQQFGATIDYLADTMSACPDHLWRASLWQTPDKPPEFAQFWYVVYHLTGAEEGFLPPKPFTLIEQDDDGPLPERVYTKAELQAYLNDCRRKCKETIETLTAEKAQRHCQFSWGECSFLELLIYNLRHVHGHASQLNMLLGQHDVPVTNWVARAKNKVG
jgi:hypothetical protein